MKTQPFPPMKSAITPYGTSQSGPSSLSYRVKRLFLAGCLSLSVAAVAQSNYSTPYTFLTLAGSSSAGEVDGTGAEARFDAPLSMAADPFGNLIVTDGAGTVRRMTQDGVVTTIAGAAGQAGATDGPALSARFSAPQGVAVGPDGTIYITDAGNYVIRKISTNGVTSTLAGLAGSQGTQDGVGSAARFNRPYCLTVDPSGNLFVTDRSSHTIRKVSPDGTVTTIAGIAGMAGDIDGGYGTNLLTQPRGICVDGSGNIFFTQYDCLIRMISPSGVVSTVAGSPNSYDFRDGIGAEAHFNNPYGIISDGAGNLIVSDLLNCSIRKIAPGGIVTTVTGGKGQCGATDGPVETALFNNPAGITFDSNGILYIADVNNNTIRKLTPSGSVTTLAGVSIGWGDGIGTNVRFNTPNGIALDPSGNVWVADTFNNTIRRVSPTGVVNTIAGVPTVSGTNDGTGTNALFYYPTTMAFDSATNLFICDSGNSTIRKLDPSGAVTTVAGVPGAFGTNDGPSLSALFYQPGGIALDSHGNVLVADTGSHTIRMISTNGMVSTYAGSPGNPGSDDGTLATATFNSPLACATDADDNLYISDWGNNSIRRISRNGTVSTLAGLPGFAGSDDGTGSQARFDQPFGLRVDPNGNILVAEFANVDIRKITPAGVVTTIGGAAGLYKQAIDGTGFGARFSGPLDVAISPSGLVYVADNSNTIRVGYPSLAMAVNLQGPVVADGIASFWLSGATGHTAVVQGSSDLSSWTPVSTNTIAAAPTLVIDNSSSGKPWRFYRALLQ